MTYKEHIQKLKDKIAAAEKNAPAFEISVRTIVAEQAKRIFSEGINSAGGNIGQYDTKREFYINPDKSPRSGSLKAKGIEGLRKAGKTGATRFKNQNPHKTAYVKNYKDFRNRIGRRIDKVNLNLSGDLKSDFSNAPLGKDIAIPRKKNAFHFYTAITRDINIKKVEKFNDKYGRIFDLTKDERTRFNEILRKELRIL